MALSNTWSYTVTRDLIIRQAMLNVGALGESEIATTQETSDCADKLNMLVKQWMGTQDFAPGLKMWERQRASLFLSFTKGKYQLGPSGDDWAATVATSATATHATQQTLATAAVGTNVLSFLSAANITPGDFLVVSLSNNDIFSTTATTVNTGTNLVTTAANVPAQVNNGAYVWNYTTKAQRPLAIRTCILRDIFNNDTPLSPMTLEDYEILPSKTQSTFVSDPTQFYYESQFQTGNGMLYLDVGGEQDITKHLHVVYMRPVMDFNNPNDTPEYPQQWFRALCWGLSKDICSMFDAEWTADMEQNYREALAMAREADAEVTTFYFQPMADSPYS